MKTIEFTTDTLPQLSDEDEAQLRKLTENGDGQIDVSEIPELSTQLLKTMSRGQFYRPTKKQVTARLDSDVLLWLKAKGKGYQTRMNEILRQAMINDL